MIHRLNLSGPSLMSRCTCIRGLSPPSQQRVYQGYNFLAGSAYGFGVDIAAHALRLMVSRLFDRYPTLKIIIGHCGNGLPLFLNRVDGRMRHFRHKELWQAKLRMKEYWVRNFWVTTAGIVGGYERVMFSVDYPYADDEEAASWFDALQLENQVREAIGAGNARALLKIVI